MSRTAAVPSAQAPAHAIGVNVNMGIVGPQAAEGRDGAGMVGGQDARVQSARGDGSRLDVGGQSYMVT
jgi:hypothetical protein